MKSAIIDFEPIFTKWEQRFFIKKAFKKIKSSVMVNEKEILIYKIPVVEEYPSEKMMFRFISHLKDEKIDTIILSDRAKLLPVSSMLKNHFKFYDGNSVINYKLYDILRKCAESQCLELCDATLILATNKPDVAKEFILKVYKHVKRIKIKTENPTFFSDLTSFFLYEYGLFIETARQIKKQEKDIFILFDGTCELADVSFNSENKTEILFSAKNIFREIMPYVKLNQNTLEFLIHQLYGNLSTHSVKSFFKAYSVRVIKLIK